MINKLVIKTMELRNSMLALVAQPNTWTPGSVDLGNSLCLEGSDS